MLKPFSSVTAFMLFDTRKKMLKTNNTEKTLCLYVTYECLHRAHIKFYYKHFLSTFDLTLIGHTAKSSL